MAAIKRLLQAAETIGANPSVFSMCEKTASSGTIEQPIWFMDWLQRHRAGDLAGAGQHDVVGRVQRLRPAPLLRHRSGKTEWAEPVGATPHGGSAGTDTVPAMLTPGEYVVNKQAVGRYGPRFFAALNALALPARAVAEQLRGYASGGLVGAAAARGGDLGTALLDQLALTMRRPTLAYAASTTTPKHAWTPAVAAVSHLLTGALLVESAARQAGRPITLVGAADMAWVTRQTVDTLHDWAAEPTRQFELTLTDDRVFAVSFRHHETAIKGEPVLGFPARSAKDSDRLTLRLFEI